MSLPPGFILDDLPPGFVLDEPEKPWYKRSWENLKAGFQPGTTVKKEVSESALQGAPRFSVSPGSSVPLHEGINEAGAASSLAILGEAMGTPQNRAVTRAAAGSPIEGVKAARRGVATLAMEDPVVARQRAMNVAPKSKQAVRAQKEGTTAAPYLKGAKNLKDVQARAPQALQEVFQPYMDAVDKAGANGRTINGPDGPVSPRQLEELRQQTSAQLQSTRKLQPTDQQAIIQKGQAIAELTDRYRQITSALDPEIKAQGIDPKRTRATFGAIKGVQKRFEGRSTLLEGKPSGIARAAQLDLTKPLKDVGNVVAGAKDIVAGRGLFTQKPTDVAVREGFRTAEPKPNLTIAPQPPARGLPPGPIVTPPPAAGAPSGASPPIAPTSRAQRLGLLLPEQSVSSARAQLPTGYVEPAAPGAVSYGEAPPAAPVQAVEAPMAQPANIRIVRDPKTGQMKRQYLTSAGGQIIREEPISVQDVMKAKPTEITKAGASEFSGKTEVNKVNTDYGTASYWPKSKSEAIVVNSEIIPKFRGQGYGRDLYEKMAIDAKKKGVSILRSSGQLSEDSVRVWESLLKKYPDAVSYKYPIYDTGGKRIDGYYKIDLKKWAESPAAAAHARGAEFSAGRMPATGERRLSSAKARERFDMHQSIILDLKDKMRRPGISSEAKINLQDMIKEHERAIEAVKRGDVKELARDFGKVDFLRAGKEIKGVTDIKKVR